jgi:hypothetical protein
VTPSTESSLYPGGRVQDATAVNGSNLNRSAFLMRGY